MSRLALQKNSSVFHLHEMNAEWREVLHLGRKQLIAKGHRWHDALTEQTTFSFLNSGAIQLNCHNSSMRERIILHLGSGCLFREAAVMYEGQRFSVSQLAIEACEVYNFPANLLNSNDFTAKYPHLINNVLHSMGVKLGATLSLLAETLKSSPEAMVSHYLVRHAHNVAQEIHAKGISQGNLALTLGLHRSTVCRVLANLRTLGIIGKVNKSTIEIFDLQALEDFLAQDHN